MDSQDYKLHVKTSEAKCSEFSIVKHLQKAENLIYTQVSQWLQTSSGSTGLGQGSNNL